MAKEQVRPISYSAEEVVMILQRAKELGVVELKLQGFESAFEPQRHVRTEAAPLNEKSHECKACGKDGLESWMKFCRECYRTFKGNGR